MAKTIDLTLTVKYTLKLKNRMKFKDTQILYWIMMV
jgi:hypothetical protein